MFIRFTCRVVRTNDHNASVLYNQSSLVCKVMSLNADFGQRFSITKKTNRIVITYTCLICITSVLR